MAHESQPSVALLAIQRAHQKTVFARRVRVLAESLAVHIPRSASVLDIGCGDGTISRLVMDQIPGVVIRGLEFAPRPSCLIECARFNGTTIPYDDGSFDIAMFVDVLHHTLDIDSLLSEAARVSRRYVLVKDHLAENTVDRATLAFMDWVGNRPHGVVLPYNFRSLAQWRTHLARAGLRFGAWQDRLALYPGPFNFVFGRKLHFVAIFEKF